MGETKLRYSCNVCTKKFETSEKLREHWFSLHSPIVIERNRIRNKTNKRKTARARSNN